MRIWGKANMFRLMKLNPPNGWRAVMWELGRGLNQSLGHLGGQMVGDITALKMVPVGNFASDTNGRSGTLAFCRAQGLPMISSTAAMVPVD